MNRLALAFLLLAAACAAPYQQMRQSYVSTAGAVVSQDRALAECRFRVAQDPAAIDWYMVNTFGTPISAPDGTLTALTDHGMSQMQRCMALMGYQPGPMVPYP